MVVGITGQIGSGKSTLISYLKDKGYTCLLEDEIAREIKNRTNVREELNKHFGKVISDAQILEEASKDFNHLVFLNNLLHPLVYEYVLDYINNSDEEIIFIESALPKEAKFDTICDLVIVVMSNYEIRLSRVMDSRNLSQKDFDLLDSRQEKTLQEFMVNNDNKIKILMNNDSIDSFFESFDEIIKL